MGEALKSTPVQAEQLNHPTPSGNGSEMAVDSVAFSLESTESSPWFRMLGRGKVKCEVAGTWAGTVTLDRRRPDDTVAVMRDILGSATAFTANPGLFEVDDAGPMRFTFTRVSGTAQPYAFSENSLLDFPYGYSLQDGSEWLTEASEYLEMENA